MRTNAFVASVLAFAAAWAIYELVSFDPDSGLWWEILLVAAASATASLGALLLCMTGYPRIAVALLLSVLLAVAALQRIVILAQASRPISFDEALLARNRSGHWQHCDGRKRRAFAPAEASARHPRSDGRRDRRARRVRRAHGDVYRLAGPANLTPAQSVQRHGTPSRWTFTSRTSRRRLSSRAALRTVIVKRQEGEVLKLRHVLAAD